MSVGDERLKNKDEESILLTYTVLLEELEHLKLKTRLIGVRNTTSHNAA